MKSGLSITVNCNARNTRTNSSKVKPDVGLDQDRQWKVNYKTNWKADRKAKNFLRGYTEAK